MLVIILSAGMTLLLAYVVYILLTSDGSEYTDNSFDAFIDTTSSHGNSSTRQKQQSKSERYKRQYTELGQQVLILYGTEYGFSKELALELFDRVDLLSQKNCSYTWQPRIVNARHFKSIDWSLESVLLVVISTAGDGVPPTDAREFVLWLNSSASSSSTTTTSSSSCPLSHLLYSVLALGDSNYLHYCRAGEIIDARLSELGAKVIAARHTVDAEDRQSVESWFGKVTKALQYVNIEPRVDYLSSAIIADDDEDNSASGPTRERPYFATLAVKYNLTKDVTSSGDKETIHCEFNIADSGISWTSGDALGIYPQNCSHAVDEIIELSGWSSSQTVDVPTRAYQPVNAERLPLRTVLLQYYDLKNVSPDLLSTLRRHSPEGADAKKLDSKMFTARNACAQLFKSNVVLTEYLGDREVVDIVAEFRDAVRHMACTEFLLHLKMLQPRYYSISSSPLMNRGRVCVTAAVVRYETLGRHRIGVTTTYLQDRLLVGESCPVFISRNPDFRLPSDPSLPIVMIGPGTGIAPFRAFIQERIEKRASGYNLLYFGCRHRDQDFLYHSELESWVAQGHLDLRTAFSRDQPHKVYVQDLLRSDTSAIWRLLDTDKAHLYVCGDARYMASDVHHALLEIVELQGAYSHQAADRYLTDLENTGRYQKDVWVT